MGPVAGAELAAAMMAGIERERTAVAGGDDRERRAALGQFLTPRPVAQLMAEMFGGDIGDDVSLLDPGAGTGALTAAFVARAVGLPKPPRRIRATLYEIDPILAPAAQRSLAECQTVCARAGTEFCGEVRTGDFLEAVAGLRPESSPLGSTAVIMNPPYRKISTASSARRASALLGVEVTNLYAAFLVGAIHCLAQGGILVAITPRSFCNGTYFAPLRRFLLANMALDWIHVFDSRTAAFRDDSVLQENVIFRARRDAAPASSVILTASSGPEEPRASRTVPFDSVVHPSDAARYIRLAVDPEQDAAKVALGRVTASLDDLGLAVSTGRVVDFRSRRYLRVNPSSRTVPLIYPAHFSRGRIAWPAKTRKPNAFVDVSATRSLLVPNGHFVLTRRFSAKEEKRRIVVAVYEGIRRHRRVAFENHLNYFHEDGKPLARDLAWGLALFLSSSWVENYFRAFSGHTQVNAADLRSLRYPSRDVLTSLGRGVSEIPTSDVIEQRLSALLTQPTE